MVSYEVSIGLILITVLLCTGTLNITEIVLAQEKIALLHILWAVPVLPSVGRQAFT